MSGRPSGSFMVEDVAEEIIETVLNGVMLASTSR